MHLRISIAGFGAALALLRRIDERTRHMATQDDINRLTETVTASTEQVTAATSAIRQDIADLRAAHPDLDLSSLEESVGQLGTAVGGLQQLDAENPVPAPVDPEQQPAA